MGYRSLHVPYAARWEVPGLLEVLETCPCFIFNIQNLRGYYSTEQEHIGFRALKPTSLHPPCIVSSQKRHIYGALKPKKTVDAADESEVEALEAQLKPPPPIQGTGGTSRVYRCAWGRGGN